MMYFQLPEIKKIVKFESVNIIKDGLLINGKEIIKYKDNERAFEIYGDILNSIVMGHKLFTFTDY